MELSARIKELGLNKDKLGKMIGVSEPCICLWCTRARSPKVWQIPAIAEALQCSIEDVVLFFSNGKSVKKEDIWK